MLKKLVIIFLVGLIVIVIARYEAIANFTERLCLSGITSYLAMTVRLFK